MNFKLEALHDLSLGNDTSYLMDFSITHTQQEAAIVEGKLLTFFGDPAYTSENYENSFNYIIRATSDDGRSVILTVYGMGIVHIGAKEKNEFSNQAANALIQQVSAVKPADFERTVYYLDLDMQLDISVVNGKATVRESHLSQEKAAELIKQWYE